MPPTSNQFELEKMEIDQEVDVEFGQLPRDNDLEMPGYLPVIINGKSLPGDKIKFFGVDKRGGTISGSGVEAEVIENKQETKVAYFNMEQLVESGQYTDRTVEGVIKADNEELGRELVNTDSAIYLG